MSVEIATEQEQVDAVLEALTVLDAEPYTIQQVKRVSAKPLKYNEITVERRFGGAYRSTVSTTRRGYRIAIRSLARTLEGALEMRAASAALEGQRITVLDKLSTPVVFETAQAIGDDDDKGWYSGVATYTYVA